LPFDFTEDARVKPREIGVVRFGLAGSQAGQVSMKLQKLPAVLAGATVREQRSEPRIVEVTRDVGLDRRFESFTVVRDRASSESAMTERSLRRLRKRMFRVVPSLHSSTPEISRVDIPWK